jgi:hypothetical protein
VDQGTWLVAGHEVNGGGVAIDEWSFVAAVFEGERIKFFVDGESTEVLGDVESVASQLVVVGAALNQPLGGFTGHLKSVFAFDVALSETELDYLMTTEEAAPMDRDGDTTAPAPAAPAEESELIPHFYQKDRHENVVSARRAVDPDADEYNAELPTVEDTDLVSVELVYADDVFKSHVVDNATVTPFKLWSLEPKTREIHVGSMVTVQGSPSFHSLVSACRINEDVHINPYKVAPDAMACQIPQLDVPDTGRAIQFYVSQNGVDFVAVAEFKVLKRPWISRLSPVQALRSINAQVVDVFGMNFVNLTSLRCSIGELIVPGDFRSSSKVQCTVEPMRYDQRLTSVKIDVSVNGVDFSGEPRDLELLETPSVDSVSPTNGPRAGGTAVELSGRGFLDTVRYSVLYEQNATDDVKYVSPSLLLWRTRGRNSTGVVLVSLRLDDALVPEIPSVPFTFTPTPQTASVFPQLLPVRSDTILTLSGSGFGDFAGLLCSFSKLTADGKAADAKATTSLATFVTSSMIQCPAPRLSEAGSYAVSTSNNGQDFSPPSEAARIDVHRDLVLENASVSSGPATGGTSVEVTGKNFVRASDTACRFGDTRTRAYFVSSTMIRCVSPAWNPSRATEGMAPVPIQIALNGLEFASSSLPFQYYALPVVDAISPGNVPMNASLSLTLSGQYLVAFGGVVCRIGPLLVPGAVKSGGRVVRCASAHVSMDSGLVELGISLNGGQDFTRSRVSLLVHRPVAIRSVDTPYVAKTCNCSVTVSGRGFAKGSGVQCAFGETFTTASVLTPELVKCPLPGTIQAGRDYPLRISLNNGTHLSRGAAHVFVYDLPTFGSVTANSTGQSPVLHVTGTGFVVNGTFPLPLACSFGDFARVVAKVENASSLRCVAPDFESDSKTPTTVAIGFQLGSSVVNTALTYTYEPVNRSTPLDPGATAGGEPTTCPNNSSPANPSTDPQDPGSSPSLPPMLPLEVFDISPKIVEAETRVNLTVRGQHFKRNATFCHFSSRPEPVLAVVKSLAVALCEFDGREVEPGMASLSLSLDGVKPRVPTAFAVVRAPTIASIYPRKGPLEGKTKLLVTGTGFVAIKLMYCHFDDQDAIPATRLANTMLECLTPASRTGRPAQLRVSINATVLSADSSQFLYVDMPRLMTMSPAFGSVEGGATIVLQGRWLNASDDNVVCTFGDAGVGDAVVVNSTTVVVETPPSTIGAGDASVKCTLDGELITPLDLSYHYLPTPCIARVTPRVGLASANTTLIVDGSFFSENYPMECQFGNVRTPAVPKSASQLECIAPPHSPGVVNVRVALGSNRGGDPPLAFEYIGTCASTRFLNAGRAPLTQCCVIMQQRSRSSSKLFPRWDLRLDRRDY